MDYHFSIHKRYPLLTNWKIFKDILQKPFFGITLARKNNYNTRLCLLNLQPIEIVLLKASLVYLYKIVNRPSPLKSLLPSFSNSFTPASHHTFSLPSFHLEIYKRIFPNNLLRVWNSLPVSVLSARSLAAFRQRLDTFDFDSYLKGHALNTL